MWSKRPFSQYNIKYTCNAKIPAQHDEAACEDVHVPPTTIQEQELEAVAQVPAADCSIRSDDIPVPKAGMDDILSHIQGSKVGTDKIPSHVPPPKAPVATQILVTAEDTPPKRVTRCMAAHKTHMK